MVKFIQIACPLLFAFWPLASPAQTDNEFFLHNGDTYVIYGDSITHFSVYARMIENYVLTRYPEWKVSFYNVGWGGDTTGNLARFKRDVLPLKPTVFSDLMGMNDYGYVPVTPAKLETFANNYRQMIPLLQTINSKIRIALISPIPIEEREGSYTNGTGPQGLRLFAQTKANIAREFGLRFIDLFTGYGEKMGLGKVVYPDFWLSDDGVHPKEIGQSIMGMLIIKGMHASPLVAQVVLDVKEKKAIREDKCRIKDLLISPGGKISFNRLSQALPCPVEVGGQPARRALDLVNFADEINQDILRIQGLSRTPYELTINDIPIETYTKLELEKGVNISKPMKGPIWDQAIAVAQMTQERQLIHFVKWNRVLLKNSPFGEYDFTDKGRIAKYDTLLCKIIRKQHELNQPRWMHFTLTPVPDKPVSLPAVFPFTNTRTTSKPANPKPMDGTGTGVQMIDLGSVANWGFADTVAYDGQGGWPDHGLEDDLGIFPTGHQLLKGIPFNILDPAQHHGKSMLVLSRRFTLKAPSSAAIPIKTKAKYLVFLHTTAYLPEQGPPIHITLNYRDGTKAETDFVFGYHLMDWWGLPKELPGGITAWVGRNKVWEIRVFETPLVNPHPDRIIETLEISVPEDSFYVYGLLGLTALL